MNGKSVSEKKSQLSTFTDTRNYQTKESCIDSDALKNFSSQFVRQSQDRKVPLKEIKECQRRTKSRSRSKSRKSNKRAQSNDGDGARGRSHSQHSKHFSSGTPHRTPMHLSAERSVGRRKSYSNKRGKVNSMSKRSKSHSRSRSQGKRQTPMTENRSVPLGVASNLVQSGILLQNIETLMRFLEQHCLECPEFAASFQRLNLGPDQTSQQCISEQQRSRSPMGSLKSGCRPIWK